MILVWLRPKSSKTRVVSWWDALDFKRSLFFWNWPGLEINSHLSTVTTVPTAKI